MTRKILLFAALALLVGCGGGLNVTRVNSAQKKPNNVWVFFTVDKGRDDPVGGLTADDFTIYEDGDPISKFEAKETILNPEVAAVMYTMLLVDMSGSISGSGQADPLVDAAKSFSDRVGKTQKVGVYAFDGEEHIHSVVPFTEAQGSVQGGLDGLRHYKPKDPSTNLNGAVIEGLRTLKAELAKDPRPLKFGTIVVFTDGTDRANRHTKDEMKKELGDDAYAHYEKLAVGVGAEIQKSDLETIGKDGTELASDTAKVKDAFDRVAAKIEAHMKRFYLLSYCTPARKGEHEVKIKALERSSNDMGSLAYRFNSDGFGPPPDCDPNTKPDFNLNAPIDANGQVKDQTPAPAVKVDVKAKADVKVK